jgi:predicted nucleotidyltransferase
MDELSLKRRDRKVIIEFVNDLQAEFDAVLQGVILYGSKARGDDGVESDIDLLVILTEFDWRDRNRITDIASHISLWQDVVLMPKVFSLERWQEMAKGPYPFFNEVFKDGWPVYGEAEIFAPLQRSGVAPLYDTAVTT